MLIRPSTMNAASSEGIIKYYNSNLGVLDDHYIDDEEILSVMDLGNRQKPNHTVVSSPTNPQGLEKIQDSDGSLFWDAMVRTLTTLSQASVMQADKLNIQINILQSLAELVKNINTRIDKLYD
ncbi:hypothetical protein NDU88_007823 [Pleurodeles waltl]|uniref:Uncharacterized protein n=1 Tax=Pleurodeles waltl TaxID=8319 RepID=A0AAV7N394_PLEWA|nr:hypothetical protein NDU88_007823 [Pleurodeles waltl]